MEQITKRLSGVTNIPKEYLSDTPPPPKSIKIEITSRCNFKCSYCALKTRSGRVAKDIDWELFKKITSEARDLGVSEFGVFYVGESFTNPTLLIQCIRWLKNCIGAPYVFLTTNGSLVTQENLHGCMAAGLDSLKFSYNFSDYQQFCKMSGVSSEKTFLNQVRAARLAHKIRGNGGYHTSLYASSIRYDDEQEERMAPFLEKNVIPYVDENYWLPLFNETAAFPERDISRVGNVGNYHAPVDPLPCWSVFTACHVLSDGRMSACCHDAIGHWVMGDLKAQSFMEAWHSEEYIQLRKAHLEKNVTGTRCVRCIDSTRQ